MQQDFHQYLLCILYTHSYIFIIYKYIPQTSITIEFIIDPTIAATYILSFKQHPQQSWEDNAVRNIPLKNQGTNKITSTAFNLLPATTYCLRIVAVDVASGQQCVSPELIVDTEAVGCTPGQKTCCVVQ